MTQTLTILCIHPSSSPSPQINLRIIQFHHITGQSEIKILLLLKTLLRLVKISIKWKTFIYLFCLIICRSNLPKLSLSEHTRRCWNPCKIFSIITVITHDRDFPSEFKSNSVCLHYWAEIPKLLSMDPSYSEHSDFTTWSLQSLGFSDFK